MTTNTKAALITITIWLASQGIAWFYGGKEVARVFALIGLPLAALLVRIFTDKDIWG